MRIAEGVHQRRVRLGPCGTVDAVGECQGEVAVTCEDLVNLVEDDCGNMRT